MISQEEFLSISTPDVAKLVRESGSKVCVFPINGTRRWFALEHASKAQENDPDPIQAYMNIASQNHISLYRLFFDHGIDTLLTPEFGTELLLRGDEYVQRIGADGLARLASHPLFVDFYEDYSVRVHFYGEYQRYLSQTSHGYLVDLFKKIEEITSKNTSHRLFIGVFGADATQTISEYSVEYHKNKGVIPNKEQIIEMYYGESVEPVNLFIGFDKFSAFDYPLLSNGEEDLYFTVAPSPYMSQSQLRSILYDHIYTRQTAEIAYEKMPVEDFQWLKAFYTKNIDTTFGTGIIKAGVWIPTSQLSLPG